MTNNLTIVHFDTSHKTDSYVKNAQNTRNIPRDYSQNGSKSRGLSFYFAENVEKIRKSGLCNLTKFCVIGRLHNDTQKAHERFSKHRLTLAEYARERMNNRPQAAAQRMEQSDPLNNHARLVSRAAPRRRRPRPLGGALARRWPVLPAAMARASRPRLACRGRRRSRGACCAAPPCTPVCGRLAGGCAAPFAPLRPDGLRARSPPGPPSGPPRLAARGAARCSALPGAAPAAAAGPRCCLSSAPPRPPCSAGAGGACLRRAGAPPAPGAGVAVAPFSAGAGVGRPAGRPPCSGRCDGTPRPPPMPGAGVHQSGKRCTFL